jgi:hypothetical protein
MTLAAAATSSASAGTLTHNLLTHNLTLNRPRRILWTKSDFFTVDCDSCSVVPEATAMIRWDERVRGVGE